MVSKQTDEILQQFSQLLQDNELLSLLKGLQLVMRSGDGFGELSVVIEDGHVKYVRPSISLKPAKIENNRT